MRRESSKKCHIIVPDHPGMLQKACEALCEEGLNIDCMLTEKSKEAVCFGLMLSMSPSARERLENKGFQIIEDQLFHLELPNKPGELGTLLGKLAKKDVCVRYLCAMGDGATCRVILSVDRPEAALAVAAEYKPREMAFAA